MSCLLVVVVTSVVAYPQGSSGHYGVAVSFAMIPWSVAVAVVRHGLFDIELVVNRTYSED